MLIATMMTMLRMNMAGFDDGGVEGINMTARYLTKDHDDTDGGC